MYRAVPCCAVRRAAVCCAVLCCAAVCCAVLCCGVLCCAVPCCAELCCGVLCCAVLCCAVLCCAVLCCVTGRGSKVVRSISGSNVAPKWAHAGVTNQRSPPKPQGACRTRSSLLLPRAVRGVCAVVRVQRASAPRPSLKGPVGREARHTRFVGESRRRTFLQG